MYIYILINNLSFLLFLIGLWGILLMRQNMLIILMSIELILFSISINLIGSSAYFDDITGQIISLLILTVAAAESAIGLAILVVYYRLRGTLDSNLIISLKG